MKVLLVDDHELVRTGIRRLIDDINGLEVVGEVETGEAAIEFTKNEHVDVVLMDLNMPGIGGMEATRRLIAKDRHLKIIVVTVHDSEPFPQQLFKAGAMGYLTKGCNIEEIVHAIKEVFYGRRYVSVDIAQKMAMNVQPEDENPFDKLSQREMQVMMMSMQGMKGQKISEQLNLSPKTISTYRYRLFDKLNVSNDVELTRLAMQYGLIDDTV
ncbi:UvrY/SirA/GacA family response regulator transcription factor [sulfur-oxidizing endosymbiont of Gigantopelta aegis]|uniref:UvrY/SirA/GacA family response regulator transcription factor n=1 Tax=sulfur-oxidizing endosymbiont of Gigantopelta aegis TaxID=2794934 RepID=UPI0018DD694D|nr:UvrY/SirA/GacA family response regulator transcription factor [sulfur-oxidizing endosymbiont of Gigantopelta aegis]